ncbi:MULTISPECIES: hypothetical protein [Leptospira]|uniref:Uncharacterized protein n=1 Tax=Leptospira weilii str. UI 13098 TaxID=1088542 RepID=M6QL80_9LEPT|nr:MULTISPECIES: hypothetical protein [Leptospira]EMN89657.1 hypothetical protein LEP1GSC108_2532 [Leptospira weilii str. UI 13098]OMI18363.1 hypothetical protein BUQ74_05595 [Leptospira weilii serovar Heyan]
MRSPVRKSQCRPPGEFQKQFGFEFRVANKEPPIATSAGYKVLLGIGNVDLEDLKTFRAPVREIDECKFWVSKSAGEQKLKEVIDWVQGSTLWAVISPNSKFPKFA